MEHVAGFEPGSAQYPLQVLQVSEDEKLILCFLPLYASSNEIDKSYLRSVPLKSEVLLLLPLVSPKPSKKSSKTPEPKISENALEKF